jgi:bacteriorhodopsin
MIVTGLVAGLSPTGSGAKWLWYLISSGAFLFIYYCIWGPMRREATLTGERAVAVYKTNATFLSVVWLAYPIVFLIGSEGIEALDPTTTGACYTVLDLIAKVVFGIVSLAGTRRKAREELASGEIPAHDQRPTEVAYHEVMEPGRTALTEPGSPASPVRR